ncbi:Glucose-induced degradation protein 4-like protein [Smittium mucronatum]|uniref:Glucose-induced degradation protein 4-like protein n=1 Tax=Smittium mucronatum TaxID=133383 RepID=A0A1R0GX81_9FUNG|nr:Glucose-induced degradation protein 4-like protein [Smittium mucronatum]
MFSRPRIFKKPFCDLYCGSKFKGFQTSEYQSYPVTFTLKYVDFNSAIICGYLSIAGLVSDEISTFFETEIVGLSGQGFVTGKWGASESVDLQHWRMFDHFPHQFLPLEIEDFCKYGVVFMRIKELFLVPDHSITYVNGAVSTSTPPPPFFLIIITGNFVFL